MVTVALGAAAVVFGLWQAWQPLGWIAAGAASVAVGLWLDVGEGGDR